MNYDDDELMEEKSFKAGGSEEDEVFDDVDETLEPGLEDDLGFDKGEEPEDDDKSLDKDTY